MVKDESKQLMKMMMQSESVVGGGEGRDVRMDRKASTPAKNDDIVEMLPEDKVGMFFLSLGLSCLTLSPFEGPACSSYPNL